MTLLYALFRMLVFPGLLFAVPASWFFLWLERKAVARMQQRVGPPFLQPFYDFIKLMGKTAPARTGVQGSLMSVWPILAVAAAIGALSLLPVFPGAHGFTGDLILLLALLEVPSFILVAAGFSSRSLFGEIGAIREAILAISYSVVLVAAVLAIAASQHTFRLDDLAAQPTSPVRWIAVLAILVCIPAKLHINPFSVPNAEQEIYAGPMTEYAGPELALWEVSHGLEWVALTGLLACIAQPRTGTWSLDGILFLTISIGIVLLLSALAAATARLTVEVSARFYWRCAMAMGVLAVSAALLARIKL